MKKGGRRSRIKGEPAFYDEMKKRVGMTLTPTAIEGLDHHANIWNVSKSELVEQIGRVIIPLPSPEEVKRLEESSASTKPNPFELLNELGSTKGEKPT